jgi:hypothetical protein
MGWVERVAHFGRMNSVEKLGVHGRIILRWILSIRVRTYGLDSSGPG